MVSLLIHFLIICLVLGLIWYIVTLLPLPHPFGKIAQAVVVVIGIIALIYLLLGVVGDVPSLRRL